MNTWHPLPRDIYSLVEQTPGAVLLHSARPASAGGLSRLFVSPVKIIEVRELAQLPALFSAIEDAVGRGQFAAGFFAYECLQYFEPSIALSRRSPGPLAWFAIYDRCYGFDHNIGTFDWDPPRAESPEAEPAKNVHRTRSGSIDFALDQQQFANRITRIHDWIRAGDVYQLNFTFPLRMRFPEAPAALYAHLSEAQPVDYGAFLHTQSGSHILSFSPELFFTIDRDRHITTQPMKGTARRGRTTAEDREQANWLANDPKNRAENVMIVDLLRNDLGRICSFGSVQVERLFEVERYLSLWQMTSRISGDLQPAVGIEAIFRALFPCGSVTGAPKVRAMQLLAELENEPRGVYTGSIGFFSNEQTIFNVAIRTLELENNKGTMGIGSGIVIDSEPASEFRECQLKAEFLTRSAEHFSLIETLLWNSTFPLLDLPFDRLTDSADSFTFRCDRDAMRSELLAEASQFSSAQPRRVRLLLNPEGAARIASSVLPDSSEDQPARVCISTHRTDPADRFLFHKTTHRELYDRAFSRASAAGFADVLFLNQRDELTEGAVSNVFIEKSGLWYTPPLECGVLPGVYRRHLLATRAHIEEKILSLHDLKAADGVYICNAVRGLRRVVIDWSASLPSEN